MVLKGSATFLDKSFEIFLMSILELADQCRSPFVMFLGLQSSRKIKVQKHIDNLNKKVEKVAQQIVGGLNDLELSQAGFSPPAFLFSRSNKCIHHSG